MIQIGIIGVGKASKSWYIPELSAMPGVKISAVSTDIVDNDLKEWCNAIGTKAPNVFVGQSAWHEVLDSEVDAVIVATPNHLHAPIALAAIHSDKHVLVEKPLCLNMDEGRTLLDATNSQPNLITAVAFKHRYMPNRAKAKDLLVSGDLGPINKVTAIIGHRGPQHWSPDAKWFFDKKRAGGGSLIDLGPHKLDDLQYVTGEQVVGSEEARVTERDGIDVEADVRFKLASSNSFSLLTSWRFQEYRDQVEIFCDRGWMCLGQGGQLKWEIDGQVTEKTFPPPVNDAGMYQSGVCSQFIAAIRGEPVEVPTFAEGVYGLVAIEAAYESYRTGSYCPIENP
jgi:UDP-N-acetylglucosamine 3-dehydrogenase